MTGAPSRRALLAGAGAMLAAPAASAAVRPDPELLAACAEHPANITAYNNTPFERGAGDALRAEYVRTRDIIDNAEPQTMAELVAMAGAAKAEAENAYLDGDGDNPEGTPAADWAWTITKALLRLYGGQP